MSSNSDGTQAQNEKRAVEMVLREALRQDIEQFLDVDVHIAGYVVAWISRNCDLAQLENLVDEMDAVFRVNGRSILTGQPRKSDRL